MSVDGTDPQVWMLQWFYGEHDMVECPVCGWLCERMEIREMSYEDDACGYTKIRFTEHWCPSCGHDWTGEPRHLPPSIFCTTDVAIDCNDPYRVDKGIE